MNFLGLPIEPKQPAALEGGLRWSRDFIADNQFYHDHPPMDRAAEYESDE
jgi:hypothetical protein